MSARRGHSGGVLVIGAGAIGGAVAVHLSLAGVRVEIADPWAEHVAAIRERGLRASGARGEHVARIETHAWTPGRWAAGTLSLLRPSTVVIATKSSLTEAAAMLAVQLSADATTVVSLQNGINEDLLASRLGHRVVGAVTEIGGYVAEPGAIVETRADGGFVIGELDGSSSLRIATTARILSHCAPTTVSENIRGHLWSKLTWNCMMNPLCALSSLGQGQLLTDDRTRALALAVGREAAAVAAAEGARLEALEFFGIDLPALLAGSRDAEQTLIERYSAQMLKTTSMSQDVAAGRGTEIDALNGHVVARARKLGLAAPLNERITALVHAVQDGAIAPGAELIRDLDAERV